MSEQMFYQCSTCGENHEDPPGVGFRWPDHYFDVPESERESRVIGDSNICRIDDEYCFIRGIILVPIVNHAPDTHFGIGVWISQSPENFVSYLENYDSSDIGPYFGWLCNTVPFYDESTQLLKTKSHFQGGDKRPSIEVAPCDHRLFYDWSEGITMDRAFEYSRRSGR